MIFQQSDIRAKNNMCFPVINKKIARIVRTAKGGNKNSVKLQLRYIHYDELMITKIDGTEDIATSLSDSQHSDW